MPISYTETIAPLSVGDSLSRAWEALKANIWLFAGFSVLFIIAFGIVGMIPGLNLGAYLFSFVLPVSVYTAIEAADGGREIQFSDFFNWTPKLSRLLIGNLIQLGIAFVMFVPLFLTALFLGLSVPTSAGVGPDYTGAGFLVVGLIMFLCFCVFGVFTFSLNFLLLKLDLSMGATLRLSWKTGWRHLGGILLIFLLCIGLYILGSIALLIGLLVTIPLMFATQYFYLSSRFPDPKQEEWDFDNKATPPTNPYGVS